MIKQLPEESRTVAAFKGGAEHRGWTVDRYFRAALIDAINNNTFAFVSANSKKKQKPPKPVWKPETEQEVQKKKENNPFALQVKAQMDSLRQGVSNEEA